LLAPRPGDLPIEQASKLNQSQNRESARHYRSPALLSLADEVIEWVVHFRNWHFSDFAALVRAVRC